MNDQKLYDALCNLDLDKAFKILEIYTNKLMLNVAKNKELEDREIKTALLENIKRYLFDVQNINLLNKEIKNYLKENGKAKLKTNEEIIKRFKEENLY